MIVPDEISLARVLRQFESGRPIPFVTTRSVQPKEWCMEFKEYDFIRNPVVQNEVFPAIEMWCVWFYGPGALT